MKETVPYILTLSLMAAAFQLFSQVDAEEGLASYYHDKFHGRRTASGEIFNNQHYTCAHPTLPFGTKVMVTNPSSGKRVVLRVNDRGPFVQGRVLDVSKRAAKEIDIFGPGVAQVSIEVLEYPISYAVSKEQKYQFLNAGNLFEEEPDGFCLRFGTFENPEHAAQMAKELIKCYDLPVYIQKVNVLQGAIYRVTAGAFDDAAEAESLRNLIEEDFRTGVITHYSELR
jgi:rare lipoprotein A